MNSYLHKCINESIAPICVAIVNKCFIPVDVSIQQSKVRWIFWIWPLAFYNSTFICLVWWITHKNFLLSNVFKRERHVKIGSVYTIDNESPRHCKTAQLSCDSIFLYLQIYNFRMLFVLYLSECQEISLRSPIKIINSV